MFLIFMYTFADHCLVGCDPKCWVDQPFSASPCATIYRMLGPRNASHDHEVKLEGLLEEATGRCGNKHRLLQAAMAGARLSEGGPQNPLYDPYNSASR